jgi:hypothetical protein
MRKLIGIGFALSAAIAVVMSASAGSPAQPKGAPPAPPLPTQVKCIGKVCGGAGGTLNCAPPTFSQAGRYVYRVIPGTLVMVDAVEIGTDVGNVNQYLNICAPAGWTLTIQPIQRQHDPFTPHGTVTGSFQQCQFVMRWQGPAQSSPFELGFKMLNATPHDVDWMTLIGGGATTDRVANWTFPLGLGTGPVHGPFPGDEGPPHGGT